MYASAEWLASGLRYWPAAKLWPPSLRRSSGMKVLLPLQMAAWMPSRCSRTSCASCTTSRSCMPSGSGLSGVPFPGLPLGTACKGQGEAGHLAKSQPLKAICHPCAAMH